MTPRREMLSVHDDGVFPNSCLAVLVHHDVIPATAEAFESLFSQHGWADSWRNGVYPFHHYHSTAHEVLGVYSGWADVQLGGSDGPNVRLIAGDVIVIPAGVAHCRKDSGGGFAVVGAYPAGQRPDMCHGTPDERPDADRRIAGVSSAVLDPVTGGTSIWEPLHDAGDAVQSSFAADSREVFRIGFAESAGNGRDN